MKKTLRFVYGVLFCVLLLLVTFFLYRAKEKETNINTDSDYIVYTWNTIECNEKLYELCDKYGNSFCDYNIYYNVNDDPIIASYVSADNEISSVEIHTYAGDSEELFITKKSKWYDMFKPLVYGNTNNLKLNYLDDYENVEKISVSISSSNVLKKEEQEVILPNELAKEVWSALNKIEYSECNGADMDGERPEFPVSLYIKDVNASVTIGSICYNVNGEIGIRNYKDINVLPLSSKAIETIKEVIPQIG